MSNTVKVVFLDRDGTINVDTGYAHRPEEWEFTHRAVEALQQLQEADYRLAVVTNQNGVAKGLHTENDVQVLHNHMRKLLRDQGVEIDAVTYCPHSPDDECGCRKPAAGMLDEVERQIVEPIDFGNSWMIGDKEADVGFGMAIGVKTILLESEYWKELFLNVVPTITTGSLYTAVQIILKQ